MTFNPACFMAKYQYPHIIKWMQHASESLESNLVAGHLGPSCLADLLVDVTSFVGRPVAFVPLSPMTDPPILFITHTVSWYHLGLICSSLGSKYSLTRQNELRQCCFSPVQGAHQAKCAAAPCDCLDTELGAHHFVEQVHAYLETKGGADLVPEGTEAVSDLLGVVASEDVVMKMTAVRAFLLS